MSTTEQLPATTTATAAPIRMSLEEWLWQDLPNMLAIVSELLGPEQLVAAIQQAQPKQS